MEQLRDLAIKYELSAQRILKELIDKIIHLERNSALREMIPARAPTMIVASNAGYKRLELIDFNDGKRPPGNMQPSTSGIQGQQTISTAELMEQLMTLMATQCSSNNVK